MLSIINVDNPDVELSGAFPDFIMRGFASYTLRVVYRSIFPESFICTLGGGVSTGVVVLFVIFRLLLYLILPSLRGTDSS